MAVSVELGGHLDKVVEDLIATGRYNSKSEVLREGVRLVEEREKRLAALDAALAEGIAAADRGEVEDVDAVFDAILGPSRVSPAA